MTKGETGEVALVPFVPIHNNTIAYVSVGDQWDLWIARGVSARVSLRSN